MPKPSAGKLLYHITHIKNMPSILESGLLPRHILEQQKTIYQDIADPDIIEGRRHYKKDLANYVPFHFYAKNPFDGAVSQRYGSNNLVIITIPRKLHEVNEFLIIPTHPLDRSDPEIFPYEEGFKLIRWDILDYDSGSRNYHDPEIKKACMAECDVQYRISPERFAFVYVYNQDAYDDIAGMKNSESIMSKLKVNAAMFKNICK